MSDDAAAEIYLDPREREYTESLAGDERETVVSTVTRFRRPDLLRVGDLFPDLEVLGLDDGQPVRLGSLVAGRPLVLVFGSFT